MTLDYPFFALLIFTVVREIYFLWTVNKLVNKLMCRSLHEYNLAESVYKRKKETSNLAFKEDEFDREDLGSLSGVI